MASLTVFRDHPESVEGPDVAQVERALNSLFPPAEFRLEHRAMVVDGDALQVFDVFRRDRKADAPPSVDRGRS